MSNPVGEIVLNGGLFFAIPIALAAGILSFASPCVLPLVPGYLGYLSGFAGNSKPDKNTSPLATEEQSKLDRTDRRRLILGVLLFILGFSLVFVTFGLLFGFAGLLLKQWLDLITRIAGVIVFIMGLVFVGSFSFLQRTLKPNWRVATGLIGAPFLGIVFGLGWAPCMGPTLVAVLALSIDGGSPLRGGILGLSYCLGLGIPFLLIALGFGWVAGSVQWIKRHIRAINIIGGILLMVVGLLMVIGIWRVLISSFGAVIQAYVTPL